MRGKPTGRLARGIRRESVGYKNGATVAATSRKGTDDEVTFIFKRDGLWSWKLSAVNLPIDKFGSN
ncbi:hypothetical protein CFB40_12175 [Burkholderia sp. AU31652]|nr:hypothetical protein CFB40_12175 [Burkholderia sp. AU31652]